MKQTILISLWGFLFLCATTISRGQYNCSSPLVISGNGVHFGSTIGVEHDGLSGTTCGTSVNVNGQVWYSFTPQFNGVLQVSTLNTYTNWDTKLHVFSGVCGALVCEGGNDDSATLQSFVEVPVTANEAYFIRMSGFASYEGNYRLDVNFAENNPNGGQYGTLGCTDPAACNYNSLADINDLSCCYGSCKTVQVTGGLYPGEVEWYLYTSNQEFVAQGGGLTSATYCLSDCEYSIAMFDAYGDGWNGAELRIIQPSGEVYSSIAMASGGGPVVESFILEENCNGAIAGCTSPVACNYEPYASIDDGTCCFGECDNIYVTEGAFSSEVSWQIVSESNGVVAIGNPGAPFVGHICVTDPSCDYSIQMFDSFGDGWNNAYYYISTEDGQPESSGTLADGSVGINGPFFMGDPTYACSNPQASNYEPLAECSNTSSCVYCGSGVPYEISVELNEITSDLPMVVAVYDEAGENVFYDAFYPMFDQDYFNTICLQPGCYFISCEYNYESFPSGFFANPAGGGDLKRGFVQTELSWTLTNPQGFIVASGSEPGAQAFSVSNSFCPIPANPIEIIAPQAVCNGTLAQFTIHGMPNAQVYVSNNSNGNTQLITLNALGVGTASAGIVYDFASFSVFYTASYSAYGYPPYAYQDVVIQGVDLPVASIVGDGSTICEGDEVTITMQGTPNSVASYTIFAQELDMIYEIFSGSLSFDGNGIAEISTGTATLSLDYFLQSVAVGSCVNSVFDSYYVAVQDPIITETTLSTSSNVFCSGDVVNAMVDQGIPENYWSPNIPEGGTPGSTYSWYVVTDAGAFYGTALGSIYTNQFSLDLGSTTPGFYRLIVTEYTSAGCASPSVSFPFEVRDYVSPNFANIGPYCIGETPQQFPTTSPEGITGSWFPPVVTTNYGSLSDYYVQVNYNFFPDDGQCANNVSKTVTVIAYPETQLTVDGPTTFCQGDQVTISAADAMCYRWFGNPGCSSFNQINATTSGTYWAYLINSFDNYVCDMQSDEVVVTVLSNELYYEDADGDGYGNPNVSLESCFSLDGYVMNDGDCNDQNAGVNPLAIEVCDGQDNDCDYQIDELPANAILNCNGECILDTDGDGVCNQYEVPGCTQINACNFNPLATDNNSSCIYPQPYRDCAGNCINDADNDGICDELEIGGCPDAAACNYDPNSTAGTESCIYPTAPYNCVGDCVNDSDNDGVCDELEISGCQDQAACNYNPGATNAGLCIYPLLFLDCAGNCLNDLNGNGICDELDIEGCTDMLACNYVPQATFDDGTCTYPSPNYDCDGNCLIDSDGDGVCDPLEIPGCTLLNACNYNASATENDETCIFPAMGYDCAGNCVIDTNSNGICDPEEGLGCTDATACNYDMNANVDNGTCTYPQAGFTCNGECLQDTDNDGVCDFQEISGCTDALACNYNELATDNDGSCVYAVPFYDCLGVCIQDMDGDLVCDELETPGCTDFLACNYNSSATDEDGSCVYAEPFLDCGGLCILDSDNDGVCDESEIAGCTNSFACNYNESATDDDGSCIDEITANAINGLLNVLVNEVYVYSTDLAEGQNCSWDFEPSVFCLDSCSGNTVTVNFPDTGVYMVTITVSNAIYPDCFDTQFVEVHVTSPVNVAEYLADASFEVFPNPFSTTTIVEVNRPLPGSRIMLYDSTARLIWDSRISTERTLLDGSELSAGLYTLNIVHAESGVVMTKRILKQ